MCALKRVLFHCSGRPVLLALATIFGFGMMTWYTVGIPATPAILGIEILASLVVLGCLVAGDGLKATVLVGGGPASQTRATGAVIIAAICCAAVGGIVGAGIAIAAYGPNPLGAGAAGPPPHWPLRAATVSLTEAVFAYLLLVRLLSLIPTRPGRYPIAHTGWAVVILTLVRLTYHGLWTEAWWMVLILLGPAFFAISMFYVRTQMLLPIIGYHVIYNSIAYQGGDYVTQAVIAAGAIALTMFMTIGPAWRTYFWPIPSREPLPPASWCTPTWLRRSRNQVSRHEPEPAGATAPTMTASHRDTHT